MKTIGIKFCGGCNPLIERSEVADELKSILPEGFAFDNNAPSGRWDIGILICGCHTACADRPELRSLAATWILVSGPTVDRHSVSVEDIAQSIAGKLGAMAHTE